MSRRTRKWLYEPLESQQRFHAGLSRFKGFSGPIGSGKSCALVYEALFLSHANPGLPGLIGAPTYPMLRDSTQTAFFEVLEQEQLGHSFLKSENRVFMHQSRSSILFRTLDDAERLRGTNLAWFGVDELTYCTENAWLRLEGRLRHPRASRLEGFAAWTPKGYDWVYRRFVEKSTAGYEATFATPRENTHLQPDFYDRLALSYDPRFFEQEGEGKYLDVSGGTVYHAYSPENKRALEYDPNFALVWALDFNRDPMCSVIGQLIDRTTRAEEIAGKSNRTLHILDEICLPDSYTEQACREFLRRTEKWVKPGRLLVVDLYGDASGSAMQHANTSDYKIIYDFFAQQPAYRIIPHIPAANPAVRERVNAVNAAFRNALGEKHAFIDPGCQELDRDLKQVKWKKDLAGNSIYELDKRDPRRTHVSDAFGYLIWKLFAGPVIRIGSF